MVEVKYNWNLQQIIFSKNQSESFSSDSLFKSLKKIKDGDTQYLFLENQNFENENQNQNQNQLMGKVIVPLIRYFSLDFLLNNQDFLFKDFIDFRKNYNSFGFYYYGLNIPCTNLDEFTNIFSLSQKVFDLDLDYNTQKLIILDICSQKDLGQEIITCDQECCNMDLNDLNQKYSPDFLKLFYQINEIYKQQFEKFSIKN